MRIADGRKNKERQFPNLAYKGKEKETGNELNGTRVRRNWRRNWIYL